MANSKPFNATITQSQQTFALSPHGEGYAFTVVATNGSAILNAIRAHMSNEELDELIVMLQEAKKSIG